MMKPLGFPGNSDGKVSACNSGDQGLIPGLKRYFGEGNRNKPQYSCLENSMTNINTQTHKHNEITNVKYFNILYNLIRFKYNTIYTFKMYDKNRKGRL